MASQQVPSMNEVRRLRLLRFEQQQQHSLQPQEQPTIPPPKKETEQQTIATTITTTISTAKTVETTTSENMNKMNASPTTSTISTNSLRQEEHKKQPYTLSNELYSLLWGNDSSQQTSFEDKIRWIQQEITFKTTAKNAKEEEHQKSSWSLGLLQHHGGPCGVLAALQAEMIRFYYFDDNDNNSVEKKTMDDIVIKGGKVDEDVVINCLLHAMGNILSRSISTRNDGFIRIILPCKSNWKDMIIASQQQQQYSLTNSREDQALFEIHTVSKANIVPFLQQHNCYETIYGKEGGIFLFCVSLLESRSIHQVQQDMDDPNTTLISQFGHCTQECLNLLLTGIATSNVFDHTIDLGSNTILKGVTSQPDIGYLTQLEFLRYCAVGYFYKTPTYPIWIVGSTNHFTVLFCLQKNILDHDENGGVGGENKIRDFAKSVFQCYVDDRMEDHGFVKVEVLGRIIHQLDLSGKIGGEDGVHTLAAILEINGAGIILWSDFWNIIRPLMLQQKSFSTILQEHDFGGSTSVPTTPNDIIKNNDEEFAKQLYESENTNVQQQQDDEEFARNLQAQWNAEDVTFVEDAAVGVGSYVSSSMDIVPIPTENSGVTAFDSLPSSLLPSNNVEDMACSTSDSNVQQSQQRDVISTETPPKLGNNGMELTYCDDDKSNQDITMTTTSSNNNKDSFIVYHYNGLKGGILSTFRIIPFPSETASITDNKGSPSSSRDLEDVIRTKWPKCKYVWDINNDSTMNTVRSLID